MSNEEFSVYNAHLDRDSSKHPLRFLLPENQDIGWPARRSLKRPLNHLGLLVEKEEIAEKLDLHNTKSDSSVFDRNYAILERHQKREVDTKEAIRQIASISDLSVDEVTALLREYATVGSMEFHPSDVCNLACRGCTYGHGDPSTKPPAVNFPFESISRIVDLQPRGIMIVGGGEPVLYKSEGHRFQDMVEELSSRLPDTLLALKTNGTFRPPGDWTERVGWIRVSLDAATAETYESFRQKPFFDRVIATFLDYLDSDVEYVGISFLFSKSNIPEYAQVAEFLFNLVKKHNPDKLGKTGIEYRPLRRDPRDYNKPFGLAIDGADIQRTLAEVRQLAETSDEMRDFLKYQTNITAFMGGNSHPSHDFERCYYSQIFHIVRANGELRPCYIRVVEPDFVLGNIITDSLESIALNSLYIGAKRKEDCDPHGCRQCYVNYMLEQGLAGNIKPSESPDIKRILIY